MITLFYPVSLIFCTCARYATSEKVLVVLHSSATLLQCFNRTMPSGPPATRPCAARVAWIGLYGDLLGAGLSDNGLRPDKDWFIFGGAMDGKKYIKPHADLKHICRML